MIKLVVLDLDHTLWEMDHGFNSNLEMPLCQISENEIQDSIGNVLHIRPDARELLDWLKSEQILISVATATDPYAAKEALALFGILGHFIYTEIGWIDPEKKVWDKSVQVQNIINYLNKEMKYDIKPEEVILIDDMPFNIERVTKIGVKGYEFGKDIKKLTDIIKILKGDDKPDKDKPDYLHNN